MGTGWFSHLRLVPIFEEDGMSPIKYLVLSWSQTTGSVVSVAHNLQDAQAAAAAVDLSAPLIGAGVIPLVGSETLQIIQGVNSTGTAYPA